MCGYGCHDDLLPSSMTNMITPLFPVSLRQPWLLLVAFEVCVAHQSLHAMRVSCICKPHLTLSVCVFVHEVCGWPWQLTPALGLETCRCLWCLAQPRRMCPWPCPHPVCPLVSQTLCVTKAMCWVALPMAMLLPLWHCLQVPLPMCLVGLGGLQGATWARGRRWAVLEWWWQ